MRSRSSALLLGIAIVLCVFLAACGSSNSGGGGGGGGSTPPVIATSTLPGGTVGTAYSTSLLATGGAPPYTWSVTSGSLPAGLTLSSSGTIRGTPTAAGKSTFTVQVTDSKSLTASASLSITVTGVITISPASLPNGALNVAYNQTLSASGGIAPYTWSVKSGSLPPGLTLSSSGAISGTPTTIGVSNFTVQVTDSESPAATAQANFSITILGSPLQITTSTLPNGAVNVAYSATLAATGGNPPYTWTLVPSSGNLPAGLSLSSSGVISGTPTASGTSTFTVQVADSESPQATASASLSITITNLAITNTSLPAGIPKVTYQAILTAIGGTPPYTWSVISGQLPDGLSLNASTGAISGSPSLIAQSQNFTVQVNDSSSPALTAQAALGININQSMGNGALKGNYVFSVSGYVSDARHPLFMAGSFVADGAGNITSGVLDENIVPTPLTDLTFTGTYSIQPNGLGTMTLNSGSGPFNFKLALSSITAATHGGLSLAGSPPAPQGSGSFQAQTLGVGLSDLTGNYASGFYGVDSKPSLARLAGAGAYQITAGSLASNNSGGTSHPADVNDGGTLTLFTMDTSAMPPPDPQTGRGPSFNVFINSQQTNYVYYIVSANEILLLPVDALSSFPPFVGQQILLRQAAGSFDNTFLDGTAIAEVNGVSQTKAAAGLALFAGDGKGNATLSVDENIGGVFTGQQSSSGTYSVASYGRVTLSNTITTPAILYLVDLNRAFLVGQDASTLSGQLEAQTGSPFTNASFLGSYWGGTETPMVPAVTNVVSWLFPDGNGTAIGTNSGGGNLNFTYQIDSTGRAVVSGTPAAVLYVISPTKVALLSTTDSSPAVQVFGSN